MSIDTSPTAPGSKRLPVHIVCVAVGEFHGRADQYITRLLGMLDRHCPQPFELHCYTDRPRRVPPEVRQHDCSGWREFSAEGVHPTMWKLGLFNPAYVEFEEFLYLDLSLVIRNSMQALLTYAFGRAEDLVIVRDWHYDCYNSSVMRIRRGAMTFVYDAFMAGESFRYYNPGDQDFAHAVILDRGQQARVAEFPGPMIASYKKAVKVGRHDPGRARRMLNDATIVKFHGAPKMHEAFGFFYRLWNVRRREWRRGVLRGVPIVELSRQWIDPR